MLIPVEKMERKCLEFEKPQHRGERRQSKQGTQRGVGRALTI